MQEADYRKSHLGKGADYHAEFTGNPRRSLLWSIEQEFICDIARRFLHRRNTDHLDFACGTGRILSQFKNYVRSSTGVDISASMLQTAKAVVPDARLIEADITRDNILNGQQFDLITAFRFFPNAEPPLRQEVIETLYSLLRPGGLLVFNNHRNTSALAFRLVRLLKPSVPFSGMSAQEVSELVASVGLAIEKVYHVGIVPEYETRYLKTRFLVEWVESLATNLPVARLSENLLYVCRKKGQSPSDSNYKSNPLNT